MLSVKTNCSYFLSQIITLDQFLIISVFLILLFSYIYIKKFQKDNFSTLGFVLVIVGSINNLYQRFKEGCVADYFDFFGLFLFNIFDILITTGLIILLIHLYLKGFLYGKNSTDSRR